MTQKEMDPRGVWNQLSVPARRMLYLLIDEQPIEIHAPESRRLFKELGERGLVTGDTLYQRAFRLMRLGDDFSRRVLDRSIRDAAFYRQLRKRRYYDRLDFNGVKLMSLIKQVWQKEEMYLSDDDQSSDESS